MANTAFRILLTFNATSLLVIVFLVKEGYTPSHFLDDEGCLHWLSRIPDEVLYLTYLLIPIFSTGLSILLSSGLGKDEFKEGEVVSIEHANNSFLPSYLGYFFVALSIPNWETLYFVYGVLFVFTFLSQALYFNPLFLVYRYDFYNIKTKSGAAIFLISQEKYKDPESVKISEAARVNNYTFIERE